MKNLGRSFRRDPRVAIDIQRQNSMGNQRSLMQLTVSRTRRCGRRTSEQQAGKVVGGEREGFNCVRSTKASASPRPLAHASKLEVHLTFEV